MVMQLQALPLESRLNANEIIMNIIFHFCQYSLPIDSPNHTQIIVSLRSAFQAPLDWTGFSMWLSSTGSGPFPPHG